MRGEWPHKAITADMVKLISGKNAPGKVPLSKLSQCEYLLPTLVFELGLPEETDRIKQEDLAKQILTAVVEHDASPGVQMSRELIGLSAYSTEQIKEILEVADDAQVRPIDKRKGIRAKSCRQHLAGYGQDPPLKAKAVAEREDGLSDELNKAVFTYIDKHLDAAQAVARDIGLVPQSGDELALQHVIDPLAPAEDMQLLVTEAPGPYVRRSSLEAQFRRLRHERVRVICFAGPPAMGKTRLAEVLTETEKAAGGLTVRIDAGSNELLERSLDAALRSGADTPPPYGLPALEAAFRAYVLEHPPWYVLVDNVSNADLLNRLLPSGIMSTVVVTVNQRLTGISPDSCIEVERLEPHESAELILSLLPGTTKEEADQLADALAHHPMGITAACGMIRKDGGAIDSFCTGLRQAATEVFDGVTDDGHQNLTAIYRQVLAALESTDPLARLTLELLAQLGDAPIPTYMPLLGLRRLPGYSLERDHLRIVSRRALENLADRYLLSITGTTIRMHELTRLIISGLCVDSQSLRAAMRDGILDACAGIAESRTTDKALRKLFNQLYAWFGAHLIHLQSETIRAKSEATFTDRLDRIFEASARIVDVIGIDTSRCVVLVTPFGHDEYLVTLGGVVPRPDGHPPSVRFFTHKQAAAEMAGPSMIMLATNGPAKVREFAFGDKVVRINTAVLVRYEDLRLDAGDLNVIWENDQSDTPTEIEAGGSTA